MTRDYDERTELAGYRMVFARAGIIGAMLVVPWVFQSQSTLALGFSLVGYLLSATVLTGGLVCFVATRNVPQHAEPAAPLKDLSEVLSTVGNPTVRSLLIPFFMQNVALGAAATSLVYFLVYVADADVRVSTLFAVSSFLFTPVWIAMARRLEKRTTYIAALGITLVAIAILAGPWPLSIGLVLMFLIVLGAGDAGTQLAPNAMVSDAVQASEAITGERREGLVLAAFALMVKLGMAAGGYLASMILQHASIETVSATTALTDGQLATVKVAYLGLPSIFWAAALVFAFGYTLSREKFAELQAILAEKHRNYGRNND